MKPMLSKSRFLAGLQCPLRLWYQCYNRELATPVADQVKNLKDLISSSSPPSTSPPRHCLNPYKCEFWEHCTKDKPDFWVMDLSGITNRKLLDLAEIGVESIPDIPENFPLTALQERIRLCVSRNQEFISADLKPELLDVEYPIHFLDFETISPAVPRYSGTRPYETIPFQWSDHIMIEDGSIEQKGYLCLEDKDPRSEFAEKLTEALGEAGTIFTYTGYEAAILKDLAIAPPSFEDKLSALLSRFKDFYKILRRHYYHPAFHGSFSLKSVLPALVPTMDYSNLNIQEGSLASLEYLRMIDPGTSENEKERIKNDLLEYCGNDTLGMVKIRNELLKRSAT